MRISGIPESGVQWGVESVYDHSGSRSRPHCPPAAALVPPASPPALLYSLHSHTLIPKGGYDVPRLFQSSGIVDGLGRMCYLPGLRFKGKTYNSTAAQGGPD